MKTIRTSCFETNSSSTHSITITSKSAQTPGKPLEENGVLYPQNLRFVESYRSDGCDGHSLHASTVAEKTALMIHHLKSVSEYADVTAKDAKDAVQYVIDSVTLTHGLFTKVDVSDMKYSSFSAYSEDGDTYVDRLFEEDLSKDERYLAIDKFIRDVVLNPDKIIIDSEVSN